MPAQGNRPASPLCAVAAAGRPLWQAGSNNTGGDGSAMTMYPTAQARFWRTLRHVPWPMRICDRDVECVAAHQHHLGRVDGHVGARADRNPEVGSCQRRGGVNAVAHQWPPCDRRAAARRPSRPRRAASHAATRDRRHHHRRVKPHRRGKHLASARTVAAGHAFVQNLRRGHYEISADLPVQDRIRVAFDELALLL
jgi:hypothetical protein